MRKIDIDCDGLESIEVNLEILEAFSRVIGQSVYVIDYCKPGFTFVSSNPLFLCGYSPDEVLKMGYLFYEKVIAEEDLKMLLEINRKWFSFIYQHSRKDRMSFMISYDFRMKQINKRNIMVNHRLTPLSLTPKGKIRFALCIISLSTHIHPGNVFVRKDNISQIFSYSFDCGHWRKRTIIEISTREREILQLSAQGFTSEDIANTLFINISTVKFHKSNIYAKLNVKNIMEAILFALNNKLI